MKYCYGLDVGTYNIITAWRNKSKISCKKEINAFFSIPIENKFMLNMIKKSGAPVIEVGDFAYILGSSAIDLALSMGQEYRRPMRNGILSIEEKEAFNILAVIIRSMIGEVEENDSIVYYSVPANAINTETNSEYHTKVIQSILDKYNVNNKRIKAYPINEALCVILSELQEKNNTGIGISFGAGMVNICYSMFSVPMVQFSITNSGDWIDEQSARHCGENVAFINSEKEKIDLSIDPKNSVERAIIYHYELMIDQALKGIKQGIINAGTKANPGKPVDIVVAGGTASPKGFIDLFNKKLNEIKFPLNIGDVRLAEDHLYSVSKGALIAAESHD